MHFLEARSCFQLYFCCYVPGIVSAQISEQQLSGFTDYFR